MNENFSQVNSPNLSLNQTALPTSTQAFETYYKYAGFWRRFAAAFIDDIIFLVVIFALRSLLQLLTDQAIEYNKDSGFRTIGAISLVAYNIVALRFFGTTIGKGILHLKVVTKEFKKLSLWQIIKRESVGKFISGIVYDLGYLWVAIDDKNMGWHDKIAGTIVINTQPITYSEFLKLQEKKKNPLPYVLMFMGVLEIIFASSFFFIFSKMRLLFAELKINQNTNLSLILFIFIFLLALVKIIFGLILAIKQHRLGELDDGSKKIGKTILVVITILTYISIPVTIILSIILPIYNINNSFK